MKLKKKVMVGLFLLTNFIGISSVKAEENEYVKKVDDMNWKIEVSVDVTRADFVFSNPREKDKKQTDYQYVYISNGEEPTFTTNEGGCGEIQNSPTSVGFQRVSGFDKSDTVKDMITEWYILKGYNKFYPVLRYMDNYTWYCEYSSTPITVERPAMPKLGSRFNTFVTDKNYQNELNSFNSFASQTSVEKSFVGNNKKYVKVGKITNSDLLYKLTRNKEGAMQELMNYAKNDSGKVYDMKISESKLANANYTIEPNTYYYIYTYKDDDKYRDDFDDVAFLYTEDNIEIMSAYTHFLTDVEGVNKIDSSKDNIDTTATSNDPVKNPDTGSTISYVAIIAGIALVVGIGFIARKNKKIYRI